MKSVIYYEMQLQKLLPEYLLPIWSSKFTLSQQALYVLVLRDVYSCLTYQPNMNSQLAIKLVKKMYLDKCSNSNGLPFFVCLLSDELVDELQGGGVEIFINFKSKSEKKMKSF